MPAARRLHFSLSHSFQSLERRLAFRRLLALPFAAAKLDAIEEHRALKFTIVVRTGDGGQFVARRLAGLFLQNLLQLALRVFEIGNLGQLPERIAKRTENKPARGRKASIQKNRAEHGFESVGQRRLAFAAAAHFLAMAEDQVLAQAR